MSNSSVKNVLKALKQFPKNVQKNIATGAVRAGCKPILVKAKSLAPYEFGDLEKSIKITKAKSKRNERHIIHFRVSAGNFVNTDGVKHKIFYAAYVEWGHTSKNGKATMAYPFMRPAYEMEAQNSIAYTKAYYAKRIPKEIAKLRAKI